MQQKSDVTLNDLIRGADDYQRAHPFVGFPLAVIYKHFDDQGNYLAAIITYYAFIAIFPLLLMASSILGFFLQDNPELQTKLLNTALSQFPIVGDQLGRPEGLSGSAGAIIVGGITALYGAMGLGQASQNAVNIAWSVPRNSRPNPFLLRLRSILLLAVAGLAVLAVVVLTTLASNADILGTEMGREVGWLIKAGGFVLLVLAFAALFRLASAREVSWRSTLPGAIAVAIMWQGLQWAGGTFVARVVSTANEVNATFAFVLGLIAFIYIASIMVVLGVQLNVVNARKLYPRALLTPFTDRVSLTAADRRAYAYYAKAQRHKGFQFVEVTFKDHDKDSGVDPGVDRDIKSGDGH